MFDSFFDTVVSIGIIALISLSAYAYARKFLVALKQRKTAMKELDSPVKKPDLKRIRATVLSKRADTVYSGTPRFPKHELKFFATFEAANKSYEFEVSKEVFESLNEGQRGVLIVSDGNFIDFDIR